MNAVTSEFSMVWAQRRQFSKMVGHRKCSVMFELNIERLIEVSKMKKKKGISNRDQHM